MNQRGRKSAASMSVAPLENRRPSPPECLNAAEAETWRAVVGCWPADHFRPDSYEVLIAYCKHSEHARLIDKEINSFKPQWLSEDGGLDRYQKLLSMRERETRAINAVARSLRITHQAKYSAKLAGATSDRTPTGGRPWE